jgi:hypothetical protein
MFVLLLKKGINGHMRLVTSKLRLSMAAGNNAETRSSFPLVIFFPTQNPISLQVVRVPF